MVTTKKCYACKRELPLDMFHSNKAKVDGLGTECKECKSIQDKIYREKNVEKCKLNKRIYYFSNRESLIEKVCIYAKKNRKMHNARGTKTKIRLKTTVFSHYCKDGIKCQNCDEKELCALTIDHINGDGNKHRKEIGVEAGVPMYRWLKKNNYPDGFQVLCFNCQFKKRQREISPKDMNRRQLLQKIYTQAIKKECLEHYGGMSCPCGVSDLPALTLDHVNDDGAKHREETGTRGFNFYMYLRRNGYPNDIPLQVLCMNCQFKKRNAKELKILQENLSEDFRKRIR